MTLGGGISKASSPAIIFWNYFENITLMITATSPRDQQVDVARSERYAERSALSYWYSTWHISQSRQCGDVMHRLFNADGTFMTFYVAQVVTIYLVIRDKLKCMSKKRRCPFCKGLLIVTSIARIF